MKVKRFNNLWAMGLILFGVILVAFYVAKIFFPQFIVGVAEIPSIVAFGNYVDSHLWAFVIYHFIIAFIGNYLICCICCRISRLNLRQGLIMTAFTIFAISIHYLLPKIYTPLTYVLPIIMPFTILFFDRNICKETFISTAICFTLDIMAQSLSSVIKDVVLMATIINSSTMTVLLIDIWIWRFLLYSYYNYKKES